MWKLVALAILLAPLTAAAGDSTHQACVGSAALDTGGPLRKLRKLAVRYDEQRIGPGPDDRRTELHASSLGHGYEGTAMSNGNPKLALRLQNVKDKSDILFDGTVEVLQDSGLALSGSYKLDGKPAKLTAILECVDL